MRFHSLLGVTMVACGAACGYAPQVCAAQRTNDPPRVLNVNVSVEPQARRVTIRFDIEDTEQDDMQVELRIAGNAAPFEIPPGAVLGDVGFPVRPGSRSIVWEYDPSGLDLSRPLRIKVVADDIQPVDLQQVVDAVDSARLERDVETLQGVRHYSANRTNILAAKDFIESQFVANGVQSTRQAFSYSGWPAENMIGTHSGELDERAVYIVNGHFDTIASTPGADDNASGTAGMLEAMRVLSRYRFQKTIKFIGFDLEEVGIVGSRYYAQNIRDGERIEGLFNFEMIGYTCTTPACDAFRSVGNYIHNIGDPNSDVLRLGFDAAAAQFAPGLAVRSTQGDPSDTNLRRSDHIGFWDRGVRALFFTDGANFRNPHYHRASDTAQTLNFDFMTGIVKATVATVAQFAEIRHLGVGVSEEFSIPDATPVDRTRWGDVKGDYR